MSRTCDELLVLQRCGLEGYVGALQLRGNQQLVDGQRAHADHGAQLAAHVRLGRALHHVRKVEHLEVECMGFEQGSIET